MPSPSKTPVLVLSLIFTLLCLSMGAIALIVVFNANRPDSATIATACKSEVGAAIRVESDRVAAACKEATSNAISTFPATSQHPGFSYPAAWDAVGRIHEGSPDGAMAHTIYVSNKAIDFSCEGCDGPIIPITITTYSPKAKWPDIAAMIESLKKNLPPDESYTNVKITTATIDASPAYILKGHVSGLIEADVENIYIDSGSGSYILMGYIVTGNESMKDGWEKITSTISSLKGE